MHLRLPVCKEGQHCGVNPSTKHDSNLRIPCVFRGAGYVSYTQHHTSVQLRNKLFHGFEKGCREGHDIKVLYSWESVRW